MSKELEALQEVREQLIYYKEYAKEKLPTKTKQIDDECEEELNIIETTLKNYEELTSKPAIVCVERHGMAQALIGMFHKNFKEIKITSLEDQDKIKAFEIIKEKRVNAGNFIYWLKQKSRTYEDYLQDFYQEQWYLHYKDNNDDRCKFYKLTQDEYELLKEVLL